MTSSPGAIPTAASDMCRAAVPLHVVRQYFVPIYSTHSSRGLHLWRSAAGQDAAVQNFINQAAVIGVMIGQLR